MAFDNYEMGDAIKQAKYKNAIENIRNTISSFNGDVNNVMSYSLNAVCDVSHTVAGTFWYYDVNGDGLIRAMAVRGGADLASIRLRIGEGIAGRVIATGESTKIFDVQSDKNWSSKTDKQTGFVTKTMMCVPLTVNNYTFGCIQLINKDDDSFFDEKDFELILNLSKSISSIIDEYNIFPELREFQNAAILYLNINNYDEITYYIEPKDTINLLNEFLDLVYEKLSLYNANVDLFDYEHVLAYWIDSSDNESYVRNACFAAKEIVNLSNIVRAEISKKYGVEIYYSIGISYGRVYKHVLGSGKLATRTIAGEGISIAKFLQANADYGEILVNGNVVDKTKEEFNYSKYSIKTSLFRKKSELENDVYSLN